MKTEIENANKISLLSLRRGKKKKGKKGEKKWIPETENENFN